MDIFEELESMAVNVADECDVDFEPSDAEIARWQALFAYHYSEAVEQIKKQNGDYSRYKVPNDHWNLVKSQKEAHGYSRARWLRRRRCTSEHWRDTRKQGALSLYPHRQQLGRSLQSSEHDGGEGDGSLWE